MTITTYAGRVFDRERSHPDPRNYPAAPLLALYKSREDRLLEQAIAALAQRVTALEHGGPVPPAPTPDPVPPAPTVGRLWPHPFVLDQGQTGECVGHGWAHWLAMTAPAPDPVPSTSPNPVARRIYEDAQRLNGQPVDDQTGTSVLAGAKATRQDYTADLVSYHTCASVAEAQQAVLHVGPVVTGTDWTEGMMDADPNGVIHATGNGVGGHCLALVGYLPDAHPDAPNVLLNSWGESWADRGTCRISDADLRLLFTRGAEFWLPVAA